MAHPRHKEVRQRYQFRCGYCKVSEVDAGAEFTVDHFQPVSAGGDDAEEKLVYACFRCNLYKGDFQPTAMDLEKGYRVLHPLLEDTSPHLQENLFTGRLEPLTETGRFHILLLRLNRPQLVEHRLQQQLRNLLTDALQFLNTENELLRKRIAYLESYLQFLRHTEKEEPGQAEEGSPSV